MPDGVEVPRRIFRRSQEPLAADVSLIAAEFLAGFQLIQQIDRPAVSISGRAHRLIATLRQRLQPPARRGEGSHSSPERAGCDGGRQSAAASRPSVCPSLHIALRFERG